ncbi:hypothetical protein DSO57_1031126 [Entomophthora muscae]|uniref:Uncharacterized protein n=1 Tax=Entomophthora muscae TaxID=34485 RepID=A0ACC2SDL3_9FUNG|nr:hypothetical protein DSO57_1031126 [Entomophthora muscae]
MNRNPGSRKLKDISLVSRIFNLNSLSILFNFYNLSIYALVLVASIVKFMHVEKNILVINSFSGIICTLCIFSEFHLSKLAYDYFRFITTYRGRGALYLILGFIVLDQDDTFFLVTTYYTVSAGLLFLILSFVPHILPLNDLKTNYHAYQQYIEELKDPYAIPSHPFFPEDSQAMAEVGNSTIRTAALYDIHTIRTGYDHNKEANLVRGKSTNLPEPKGQATLAMEINSALLDIHYSDFIAAEASSSWDTPDIVDVPVRRGVSSRAPIETHFASDQRPSTSSSTRNSF